MEIKNFLNNQKDSITKIKLKLDNSNIKITNNFFRPETTKLPKTDSETLVSPNKRENKINHIDPPKIKEIPYYEETYYIDNILNFNKKLQKIREVTSNIQSKIHKRRVKLNSSTDRMDCLQVPVLLQLDSGRKLFFSNNKLEPKEMKILNFVKMNLKHQNVNSYDGKGICNAFSNRRRRRRRTKNNK